MCHLLEERYTVTFTRMHALFSFCKHKVYKDRLQEVWNFVSTKQNAKWLGKGRYKVTLWIFQMAYAEVFLGMEMDWRTIPWSVWFARRERCIPSIILSEWRMVGDMPQVAPHPPPNSEEQLQMGDHNAPTMFMWWAMQTNQLPLAKILWDKECQTQET